MTPFLVATLLLVLPMWDLEATIVATNYTSATTTCLPNGEHVVTYVNFHDSCCRRHKLVKCICMEPLNICSVSNVTKFDFLLIHMVYFREVLNSPVLQFGTTPAIVSGEAKICTVSWENVNKQMPCNVEITHENVSNDLRMWIKRLPVEIHNEITIYTHNKPIYF